MINLINLVLLFDSKRSSPSHCCTDEELCFPETQHKILVAVFPECTSNQTKVKPLLLVSLVLSILMEQMNTCQYEGKWICTRF